MTRFHDRLRALLGDRAEPGAPLSRHTSFRVGGPAEILCRPGTRVELREILNISREEDRPIHILGGGTNFLAADQGVRGAVILLGEAFSFLSGPDIEEPEPDAARPAAIRSVIIRAGAAIPMRTATSRCARRGWAGLEIMAGIPGSLGGAVAMNAGTREGSLSGIIRSVEIMDGVGEIHEINHSELGFSYRNTQWPDRIIRKPVIILSATLNLTPANPEILTRKVRGSLRARKSCQPLNFPSAGCFFRNPDGGASAGQMIDRCGCKGMAVGGAAVSEKHANFIVNTGGATAADIRTLADLVREKVADRFGVRLREEVRYVS